MKVYIVMTTSKGIFHSVHATAQSATEALMRIRASYPRLKAWMIECTPQ